MVTLPRFLGFRPRKLKVVLSEATGVPGTGKTEIGLALAEEQNPDVIILDINLPGMDGFALLRSVRQSLSTQSLPVIVLTGSANPRDELEVLETGADDFLLKPVEADRLEARVRAVLRRSGVRIAHPAH